MINTRQSSNSQLLKLDIRQMNIKINQDWTTDIHNTQKTNQALENTITDTSMLL